VIRVLKANAMGKKILVIEDNDQNRYLVTFVLEKSEYGWGSEFTFTIPLKYEEGN